MKVRDVMTSPAIVVGPEATYSEIVHKLREHGIASVPVVDDAHRPLGMVGEIDLVYREAYGHDAKDVIEPVGEVIKDYRASWANKVDARTAERLMTPDCYAVDLDEELDAVARRLLRSNRRSMPVIHDGRVVGVIAVRDVLKRFALPTRDLQRDVEATLSAWSHARGESTIGFEIADGVVRLYPAAGAAVDLSELVNMVRDLEGVVDVDMGDVGSNHSLSLGEVGHDSGQPD